MILIVGGLIALGLVAALAVVFLALGEQRGQGQIQTSAQSEQVAPPAPAQTEAREVQATTTDAPSEPAPQANVQAQPEVPVTPALAEPAPVTQQLESSTLPQQVRRPALPTSGEEQLAAGLSSQYEALTRELREVYQKSNEIERRLSLLNEIATRFEQMQEQGQGGHNGAGEGRARTMETEMNTETNLRPTPVRELDPYR